MQSFIIEDAQTSAIVDAILDHRDGEEIQVTAQDDRSIVLGFSLATVTIDAEGNAEVN